MMASENAVKVAEAVLHALAKDARRGPPVVAAQDLPAWRERAASELAEIIDREMGRLRGQLAAAKAQRDELLLESDDLHCRIASTCGWDLKGQPFEEALRERCARGRRAGLGEAACLCEGLARTHRATVSEYPRVAESSTVRAEECDDIASALRRLAQPPAEENSPDA